MWRWVIFRLDDSMAEGSTWWVSDGDEWVDQGLRYDDSSVVELSMVYRLVDGVYLDVIDQIVRNRMIMH